MSTSLMVEGIKSISFSDSCSELINMFKNNNLPENSFYFSVEIGVKQEGAYEILTHSYETL